MGSEMCIRDSIYGEENWEATIGKVEEENEEEDSTISEAAS